MPYGGKEWPVPHSGELLRIRLDTVFIHYMAQKLDLLLEQITLVQMQLQAMSPQSFKNLFQVL